jgi:hypothetical protein
MRYPGITIYTLGPMGTDASAVASGLSESVSYTESFDDAMRDAASGKGFALVACGYKSSADASKSWGDLHFSYIDELDIVEVFHASTKRMCIAVNSAADDPRTIAIHPTTEAFIRDTSFQPTFFSNKVTAVQAAAFGRCDACIGSCDVVAEYPQLRIIRNIRATMVWVLYRKRTV